MSHVLFVHDVTSVRCRRVSGGVLAGTNRSAHARIRILAIVLIAAIMTDQFTTIGPPVRKETKIRGSRFIATVFPVPTREQVESSLLRIRKEFPDATHHCYAYRIGADGRDFRFHDDHEPSGTAGKPILAAIEKSGLTDVLVVVTRYFGGTKLGAGGLTRAYHAAAESALGAADRVDCYVMDTIEVSFPHSYTGNVMHIVSREGAKIADTRYDEDVHLKLEIRRSGMSRLREALMSGTSGNIDMKSFGGH
jgi:uncharacterized YigZ family protein